ncbi:hypothetical protein ADK70_31970 [Streptomyces rimosus subsp. pseudoverticillatus]|uniref:DUF317 domain-containing protein n=1 Tax=Streptomyces rimosus TaxID=1927 RepID=UPI0006B29CF5|nr:DUF317 domain-containing protein [Streptomyces rimosus]KOT79126.1 hypothetical protein ADK70_31970 [Streptomyces rimosus subsp. pseudoverticillatus]
MPDPDLPDGDVYVSPRYLAGSTFTGDPALKPLLDQRWDLQYDDLANVYVTAPDRRVRLGYLPEGEDDGLWRITAYTDPFAQPKWGVCFNDSAPTEFVTAFTSALAPAYASGPLAYLARTHPTELLAFSAITPLIHSGWTLQNPRRGVMELRAPDGMAGLQYTTGFMDPDAELTTLEARWYLWGGPAAERPYWYATASSNTPVPLVEAVTTCVADSAPLLRWKDQMLPSLRGKAQLTPVTPPSPPPPTPLDVQRSASRRPPSLGTRSVPRWSTTTTAPPAVLTGRVGRRR